MNNEGFEIKVISELSNILDCSNGDAQGVLEAWEMQSKMGYPLSVLKDHGNTPTQAAEAIIR